MNQDLALGAFTHVIVFHGGAKKFISEKQYKYILEQSSSPINATKIQTPSLGYFTVSSIARIIEVEEFYEQYPKERKMYFNYSELPPEPEDNRTPEEKLNFAFRLRDGVVKALENYCDQNCQNHPQNCGARTVIKEIKAGKNKQLERLTF